MFWNAKGSPCLSAHTLTTKINERGMKYGMELRVSGVCILLLKNSAQGLENIHL